MKRGLCVIASATFAVALVTPAFAQQAAAQPAPAESTSLQGAITAATNFQSVATTDVGLVEVNFIGPPHPDPANAAKQKEDLKAALHRSLHAIGDNVKLADAVKKLYIASIEYIGVANSFSPYTNRYGIARATPQAQAARASAKAKVDGATTMLQFAIDDAKQQAQNK